MARERLVDPQDLSDFLSSDKKGKRKKGKGAGIFTTFVGQLRLRLRLRRFERVYRWYNATDINMGMRVLIRGKLVAIDPGSLATLGRLVIATKTKHDPLDVFEVLVKPPEEYQAFFLEGPNLPTSDPVMDDFHRVLNDPDYEYIFYSKHIKSTVAREVSLIMNNEPLRNAMNTFREMAAERVSFPYWNTLGTAALATRALQNAQMYMFIWPALIGAFLRGALYMGLDERAWTNLASREVGGKVVQEIAGHLRNLDLDHVGWIYEDLSDQKLVKEIVEFSMFYLGKIRKEIPKDYKRPREPAQIVALAGAFDSGVHLRPYKKPVPRDQVIKELTEEFYTGWSISADGTVTDRGKFDPQVVKGFVTTVAPEVHLLGR